MAYPISRGWLVCDKNICIYQEPTSLSRCVQHGAILTYRTRLGDCKTREEARAALNKYYREDVPLKERS